MRNWFSALLLLLAATLPSWAASRAENNAFKAAAKAFTDGIWERAEREFGGFAQNYPKSEQRAEAVLRQGQARCKLGNHTGAIQLLSREQAAAGPLADQYLLWLGEAQYQTSNYQAAAEVYQTLVNNHPASKLRLEASVGEAASWAGLGDLRRVADLLSQPAGAFQQLSRGAADTEVVARGVVLLAEARLAQQAFAAAEEAARRLDASKLPPQLAWRRESVLCRALLGGRQTEPALTSASNLVALARQTAQPVLLAQSFALQAVAFEELGRLTDASATFALNLNSNAPVELQQQALLKVGELALVRGRLAEAAQALEEFLQRHPGSPACDVALLTLGELQLRQHLALVTSPATNAAPTDLLQWAQASFASLLERFPQGALAGKAQLNRGWCLVLATNHAESAVAFAAAVGALPPSYDQAVARLKLADAQYQQGQCAAAVSNYSAVIAQGEASPQVRTNLCEAALYQVILASGEITNRPAADAAVGRLLEWFPESYVTESGLLIAGQSLARHGDPMAARRVFERFLNRFPTSAREAQVRLAIARTFELQREWPGAVQAYQAWLSKFGADPERPRAEYALAYASYQARDETNALEQFTRFVAQFPTNLLAPRAQWWRADYYFRSGDYVNAEKDYQLVFRTWPASELAYEARMMAGRAAIARQSWSDAIGYFTNLTSDLNCPDDLKVAALFAYGDALRRSESAETNNPANLDEAIKVFRKVHDLNATNAAAARAWGEIGNCLLQLAAQHPSQYAEASDAYQRVVAAEQTDATARSQARVGLGIVAEKLAGLESGDAQGRLLRQALDHYLDVFYYEKNLREGEQPDWFWVKEAGLKAARLAESLGDWQHATGLYQRLRDLFPPLRASLEKRIEKTAEHLSKPPAGTLLPASSASTP